MLRPGQTNGASHSLLWWITPTVATDHPDNWPIDSVRTMPIGATRTDTNRHRDRPPTNRPPLPSVTADTPLPDRLHRSALLDSIPPPLIAPPARALMNAGVCITHLAPSSYVFSSGTRCAYTPLLMALCNVFLYSKGQSRSPCRVSRFIAPYPFGGALRQACLSLARCLPAAPSFKASCCRLLWASSLRALQAFARSGQIEQDTIRPQK